jgi:hypothetical protein
MSEPNLFDQRNDSPPEQEPTKNDAGPAATEPSVQNDSSDQVYASRKRRTPRSVHMQETSLAAYAAMGPALVRVRAAVFKALVEAGIDGLADFQLYPMLPAWGESTLRPARNDLLRKGILIATNLRRYHKSPCACTVWRLASLGDGAADASTTATNPFRPHDGPGQGQQPQPPQQPARLDLERARTPEPAPQASEQSEPDAAGGAP